jgi:hypothetical protein
MNWPVCIHCSPILVHVSNFEGVLSAQWF